MSIFWNMAVKFVYLTVCLAVCMGILIQGNVNAREELNKEEASDVCAGKNDRLMSYSDINNTSKNLLNKMLTDGETIWLKDHAKYSPFISYAGCLNINVSSVPETIRKYVIVTQNELLMCVRTCSGAFYIGIMATKCYCLTDDFYLNNKALFMNDLHCDESREGLFNKAYTPKNGDNVNEMTVYKILLPQEVPRSIGEKNNKSQCVYTRTNTDRSLEYFTESCSQNLEAKGILCTRSEYNALDDTCENKQPCVLTPMVSLLKAESLCHEKSGILLGVTNNQPTLQGGVYLTGMFRVFQIVQSSAVCLAVRKSSTNGLVIEPGDCSLPMSSFCHNDIYAYTTSETVTTTKYKDTDLTTNIGKADEEEDNEDSVLIYVGIILSVCCVIVSVLLFILYRHFKSTNAPVRSHSAVNSEASAVDLLPNQTENNYTEAYAVSNIDTEEDDTKKTTTPIKPQRKTLRKPATQSSYENFALCAITNENKTYELDDSYDRINMKKAVRKSDENPYDGELNIYDHTTNNTEEEYDTVKYTNKKPPNIKAMEDYSTLSEVPCESKPT